jgi:hypothetical protein
LPGRPLRVFPASEKMYFRSSVSLANVLYSISFVENTFTFLCNKSILLKQKTRFLSCRELSIHANVFRANMYPGKSPFKVPCIVLSSSLIFFSHIISDFFVDTFSRSDISSDIHFPFSPTSRFPKTFPLFTFARRTFIRIISPGIHFFT